MRQSGLLGVAVLGLAVGAGCRSNCSDRCGLVGRTDLASRIGCREPDRAVCAPGVPASIGRPVSVTPGDELPYPNIPAPGVPESPAQPMPAIPGAVSLPGSSAHTTGEARQPK